MDMSDFREVVDCWPSVADLAADLNQKPETVKKWRTRNRIPAQFWAELETQAGRRGYPVNAHVLAQLAAKETAA